MKYITLIWITASLIGCNCSKQSLPSNNRRDTMHAQELNSSIKNTDFRTYILSLKDIQLPLTHSSISGLPDLSSNYNKEEFSKFKLEWSARPLGILFQNGQSLVTLEVSVGDVGEGVVPFIVSYDMEGHKIDSLGPYKKTSMDTGYESIENMTIDNERKIWVVNTERTWQVEGNSMRAVKGSERISIDTTIYQINANGKISVVK